MFGLRCPGIAPKLEFRETNIPHHHVLLWLEGNVVEDGEVIDGIIWAILTCGSSVTGIELRELIRKFNIHRHSPYCHGKASNGTYRFGYDRAERISESSIDVLTYLVRYQITEKEDFKVFPYNLELTLKIQCAY